MAVRYHRRNVTVTDLEKSEVEDIMTKTGLDGETADAIFRLTSLAKFKQRFIIPEAHREEAMELLESTGDVKGNTGFGFLEKPVRGL